MVDIKAILAKQPAGVFATLDGDKVKTRVFQHMFVEDGKVYFGTSSDKPVYEQMQKNPNISFCTFTAEYNPVLSINGKAVFVEDLAIKKRVMDASELVKEIYKSPDNPIFKVFYIDAEEIVTFDFASGPKVEKL